MGIEITLIGRQGCHLCEVARSDLAHVIARFAAEHPGVPYQINDLDIDNSSSFAKYSDEVPVLLLNGNQIAFWRIQPERVFALLEAEL